VEDIVGLLLSPFVLLGYLWHLLRDPGKPIWVRAATCLTACAIMALIVGSIGIVFYDGSRWGRYVFACGFAGIFLGLFVVLIGKAVSGDKVRL
jgi:hypothetical protein